MFGLPNPYVILIGAGLWLASMGGAALWWGHHVKLGYEAAIAKQNAEAEHLRGDLIAANAAKDAAASEFARNLDKVNVDANDRIAAAAGDAQRDFTQRLRRIAASRAGCSSTGTAEATHPGSAAPSPAGSQSGLLDGIAERLRRVGEGANKLAALVRDTCIPFANEVGR